VVGSPEGPPGDEARPGGLTGRAVYLRSLQRLSLLEVGQDAGDHLNLIFPVYLKLMTGFPSFHQEDVGAELLH
jgi:hypothetical protein